MCVQACRYCCVCAVRLCGFGAQQSASLGSNCDSYIDEALSVVQIVAGTTRVIMLLIRCDVSDSTVYNCVKVLARL